jgi:hypothetical protein
LISSQITPPSIKLASADPIAPGDIGNADHIRPKRRLYQLFLLVRRPNPAPSSAVATCQHATPPSPEAFLMPEEPTDRYVGTRRR